MSPREIRRLRDRLGWSMYEMARQLGVSRSTVWSWEHGQSQPGAMRQAVLRQLRGRLNEAEQERQREEFIKTISGVAAGLGVGFLLGRLFEGGAVEGAHGDGDASNSDGENGPEKTGGS